MLQAQKNMQIKNIHEFFKKFFYIANLHIFLDVLCQNN
jgi:hypothetical protein